MIRVGPSGVIAAIAAGLLVALVSAPSSRAQVETLQPPIFRSFSSQFTLLSPITPAPTSQILTLDGSPINLAAFRGKVVLLNFWATWCRPCAYEMPALDRLAATYPDDKLIVVAVSIDQDGARVVAPFIQGHRLTHVSVYLDPAQTLGTLDAKNLEQGALALYGLPISYVVGSDGRVLGYLTGAAEWDSSEARAFLDYFVRRTIGG